MFDALLHNGPVLGGLTVGSVGVLAGVVAKAWQDRDLGRARFADRSETRRRANEQRQVLNRAADATRLREKDLGTGVNGGRFAKHTRSDFGGSLEQ
ncbi:hypothetical protein [Curtobacterium sp. MCBD17_040]|uniref:hypothetical protein n=1 Tax=Curtobacterium sp. MCBD17_040 TaxID=2175674 RepID=UPI000DA84490|nr:hypothetical protein [Curtobacterium sp. MCBD17_040]WIB65336.1 hypothetical protein DEI94_18185 [Curtobacterium sp. MCBD17_040]